MKIDKIAIPEIVKVEKGKLKIRNGKFNLYAFLLKKDTEISIHYALVNEGKLFKKNEVIPFRINSACITSEIFSCEKCDCKWQLEEAIKYIEEKGYGIITYHPSHEGLGHGIFTKLKSFNSINEMNTKYTNLGCEKEDAREFFSALAILRYFNKKGVVLLGNNLNKKKFLENSGIYIKDVVNLIYTGENECTKRYLKNKGKLPEHRILKEV